MGKGDFYKMIRKTIFVIVLCLLLALLSGCESNNPLESIQFRSFPRIVYIANVDTELDLDGVTIVTMRGDGLYVSELLFTTIQRPIVEHAIDFTTPGVYEVTIGIEMTGSWENLTLTFLVQVIDEEIFNQLRTGR